MRASLLTQRGEDLSPLDVGTADLASKSKEDLMKMYTVMQFNAYSWSRKHAAAEVLSPHGCCGILVLSLLMSKRAAEHMLVAHECLGDHMHAALSWQGTGPGANLHIRHAAGCHKSMRLSRCGPSAPTAVHQADRTWMLCRRRTSLIWRSRTGAFRSKSRK